MLILSCRCAFAHMWKRKLTHTHMQVHACTCKCVHVQVCTFVHVHAQMIELFTHTHTYTQHRHAHMHANIASKNATWTLFSNIQICLLNAPHAKGRKLKTTRCWFCQSLVWSLFTLEMLIMVCWGWALHMHACICADTHADMHLCRHTAAFVFSVHLHAQKTQMQLCICTNATDWLVPYLGAEA